VRNQNSYIAALPKGLVIFCSLVLNLIAAVFGTACLSLLVGLPIPDHGVGQAILRNILLSMTVGVTVGYYVYRAWETVTAKWVWLLPASLFCMKSFGILLVTPEASAMSPGFSRFGPVWTQLSGAACYLGWRTLGCLNFSLFTIPMISSSSYSIGALICERRFRRRGIIGWRSPENSGTA
jgi:hypothetical protein